MVSDAARKGKSSKCRADTRNPDDFVDDSPYEGAGSGSRASSSSNASFRTAPEIPLIEERFLRSVRNVLLLFVIIEELEGRIEELTRNERTAQRALDQRQSEVQRLQNDQRADHSARIDILNGEDEIP